jgi:hypothetical protein
VDSKDEKRLPLSHQPGRRRSGTEKRRKSKVVGVRLNEEDYAALLNEAEAHNLTPPSYIREYKLKTTGVRSRRRPAADVAAISELYAKLNRIGNNINQIAHAMNAGQVEEAAALERIEAEFIATLKAARLALGYNA